MAVAEDTSSISLTLTSSTTGADGLVEIYTMDGTATGEKNEHNIHALSPKTVKVDIFAQ